MAIKTLAPVTMRVKIGDAELEVSGPQEFVEEKIAAFQAARGSKSNATTGIGGIQETGHPNPGHKSKTLAQLLRDVPVKSDVERVLVAGYYLETVQGVQSFTAAEIKDAIKHAKTVPPSNPSDVIAKNIKKGLMMQAGDKDGRLAYVLTTDGVEFVAEHLKS